MLITVKKLKEKYNKFNDIDDKVLERKLAVIESIIRKHTNNKFQNRDIRFKADVENEVIKGTSPYLKLGDTIEISKSLNKGLFTIKTINNTTIELNEPIFDCSDNLVTKIEYPIEIIEGATDLLDWELLQKGKENVGIASESISRHNVSYVQRTVDNTISGYPAELFIFCNDYMVMRT